jgi:hypothetical protein
MACAVPTVWQPPLQTLLGDLALAQGGPAVAVDHYDKAETGWHALAQAATAAAGCQPPTSDDHAVLLRAKRGAGHARFLQLAPWHRR